MVEDNEELLALMLQVLSKNYHVFTAKNGKQAMNIIMKEKLDLVVSDVMMPIMDGIELTKQLKSDKSSGSCLSSYSPPRTRKRTRPRLMPQEQMPTSPSLSSLRSWKSGSMPFLPTARR